MNEQMMEKLRRELLLTRIFSVISSVLMIILVVCGISLFYKYQESKQQVEAYVVQIQEYVEGVVGQKDELTKVDIIAFNKALVNMNTVIESVDWGMLNDSIASVDWKMLNDSIKGVDWTMISDSISSVDFAMLNDNIASVDWKKVSEQLEELDVAAINKAVEELDTEELTEALANMNDAVEKLRKIADALAGLAGKLGF